MGTEDDRDLGILLESSSDECRVYRFPVGNVDGCECDAVGLTNLSPSLAKLSSSDDQRRVAWRQRVCHRRLHPSGPRRGEEENLLCRLEQVLEAFPHFGKESFKLRSPMVGNGTGHRQHGVGRDGCRAGGKKMRFFHSGLS